MSRDFLINRVLHNNGDELQEDYEMFMEEPRRGKQPPPPKIYQPLMPPPQISFSNSPRINPNTFSPDESYIPRSNYNNCVLCFWFRTPEEVDDQYGKALITFIDESLSEPNETVESVAEKASVFYIEEIYNKVDNETRRQLPYMTTEDFLVHMKDHIKINAKVFLKSQLKRMITLKDRIDDMIFFHQGDGNEQVDYKSVESSIKVFDKIMQIYRTKPDELLFSQVTQNDVQKGGRMIKDASSINEAMKQVWNNKSY